MSDDSSAVRVCIEEIRQYVDADVVRKSAETVDLVSWRDFWQDLTRQGKVWFVFLCERELVCGGQSQIPANCAVVGVIGFLDYFQVA